MSPDSIARLDELPVRAGGRWVTPPADSGRDVTSVSIDSRTTEPGALFVALPGERTHGHHHVHQAASRGAHAAIVTIERAPDDTQWPLPALLVDDSLAALQRLASARVDERLGSAIRIAITGSNGKTTTKELLRAALQAHAPTYASPGNFNSETGVPLAVFAAPEGCFYAVFEIAMNNPGEIAPLAHIIRPHAAIITGIGSAHIGRLGSRDAIAREKKEIAAAFTGSETLLIPEDDPYRDFLARDVNGTVLHFGPRSQNAVIEGADAAHTNVTLPDGVLTIPLPGEHNGRNLLAVAALCNQLAIPFDEVQRGVARVSLPSGRSRVVPFGESGAVLDESYNANRESMGAALRTGRALADARGAVAVAVLGDMAELGVFAAGEHRAVIDEAVALGYRLIVAVGETMSAAAGGQGETVIAAADADAAVAQLERYLGGCEVVVVKGSRTMQLERIVDRLTGGRRATDGRADA